MHYKLLVFNLKAYLINLLKTLMAVLASLNFFIHSCIYHGSGVIGVRLWLKNVTVSSQTELECFRICIKTSQKVNAYPNAS